MRELYFEKIKNAFSEKVLVESDQKIEKTDSDLINNFVSENLIFISDISVFENFDKKSIFIFLDLKKENKKVDFFYLNFYFENTLYVIFDYQKFLDFEKITGEPILYLFQGIYNKNIIYQKNQNFYLELLLLFFQKIKLVELYNQIELIYKKLKEFDIKKENYTQYFELLSYVFRNFLLLFFFLYYREKYYLMNESDYVYQVLIKNINLKLKNIYSGFYHQEDIENLIKEIKSEIKKQINNLILQENA